MDGGIDSVGKVLWDLLKVAGYWALLVAGGLAAIKYGMGGRSEGVSRAILAFIGIFVVYAIFATIRKAMG